VSDHRHWFHALWCHFGPYGPQDVHYHPCVAGEPGDCYRVIIGPGRDCDGKPGTHERMTLGEEFPAQEPAGRTVGG
jgi:hypothetical protein